MLKGIFKVMEVLEKKSKERDTTFIVSTIGDPENFTKCELFTRKDSGLNPGDKGMYELDVILSQAGFKLRGTIVAAHPVV